MHVIPVNKIVMLLSNAFHPDPRVLMESQALVKSGYDITILCWDRRVELPPQEILPSGVNVFRIQNIRSSYGAGIYQLLKLPQFWRMVIHQSIMLHPDVVHCHDLDTLYAGVQIKKRLGCPLIYDAHEDYPALMSLYLPRILLSFLRSFEKWLLNSVDYIITASSELAIKYRSHGAASVTTIGNYQALELYHSLHSENILQARAELGYTSQDYIVAYIGGFTRNRQLLPLIDAIKGLPDVKLLLCGDGHQRGAIESAITNIPNIQYIGWLHAEKVPLYTSMADVIYYCLLPNYPGASYNAPNTLSSAMAAGRPIIANKVGDLGRIISETNCGLLIDDVNPINIREVIDKLRDPVLRNQLGSNGKKASIEKYNSATVEYLLNKLYSTINTIK